MVTFAASGVAENIALHIDTLAAMLFDVLVDIDIIGCIDAVAEMRYLTIMHEKYLLLFGLCSPQA